MAIYKAQNRRQIAQITWEERLSNQVILSGKDDSLSVPRGIFFLEYLEADKFGTVTIKDGDGDTICSGISAFHNEQVPLRCDKGIEIVGDVTIAKGFVVEDVFAQ